MKKIFLLFAVFMAIGAVKAQDTNASKYTGKIGEYEITMFVDFSTYSDGDSIGYYYYNSRPKSLLKLVQTDLEAVNAHGSMHVILEEYTPKGNHSGTFDGQFECRGSSFEGKFTNSKGKVFKFELWEQYE